MTEQINAQLRDTGSAEVLVFLSAPAAASAGVEVGAAAGRRRSGTAGALAAAESPVTRPLSSYFLPGDDEESILGAAAAAFAPPAGRTRRRARQSLEAAAASDEGPVPDIGPLLFPNLGIMLGRVDAEGLAALNADPRVDGVSSAPQFSLIHPVRVASTTSEGERTWGINAMRVPQLWAEGLDGRGVRVGHLDTGVDGKHPVFDGAIFAFAEFDRLGRQTRPDPEPFDTGDHGTHTAATIAARRFNGRSVGVAPAAQLASAIVIEGGRIIARVLGGMDWAIANDVRILNMSLGLRGFEEGFIPLTQLLRARNVLPVFAVGNEGIHSSRSPGNYPEALSVGAHDRSRQVADFSSSQRFPRGVDPLVPDLVAPGVDVVSARPGGGFQSMNGSSMATPHVSGLAALLLQAKPQATADEIEDVIFRSCSLGPGMDPERCNRGVPDAVRALQLLRE